MPNVRLMPRTVPRTSAPTPRCRRLLIALGFGLLLGTAPAQAQLDYARDPDTVVLRFQEVLGEAAGGERGAPGDRGPWIEIRGDGSTRVHYPAFMRRAGDYTTTLDAAEMDRLVTLVAQGGLVEFDATATRQATEAAAARAATTDRDGRPTRQVVFDASTTILDVRMGGVTRRITWRGLRTDAERHPRVAALQGLAQVQRELLTLMERGDLTRVAP